LGDWRKKKMVFEKRAPKKNFEKLRRGNIGGRSCAVKGKVASRMTGSKNRRKEH